jgi:hypothetical protein
MKNIFLTFALLTMSVCAYAGPISSGGGGVFVCRNAQNQITNVEMIDLWEIENIAGYKVQASSEFPDIQIEKALKKLAVLIPTFAEDIRKEVARQRNMFQPLPAGVRLRPPGDIGTPYTKEGCEAAGMMFYDDANNRLSYDVEYFSHLSSNTQIAAAYLHEAIYKIMRQSPNDNVNSVITRTIVGDILSDYSFLQPKTPAETLKNIFAQVPPYKGGPTPPAPEKVLECHNTDSNWSFRDVHTAFYYVKYVGQPHSEIVFKRFESMDLSNVYVSLINDNSDEDGFGVYTRNLLFSPYPQVGNGPYSSLTSGVLRHFVLDPVTLLGSYDLETLEADWEFHENFSCTEISKP